MNYCSTTCKVPAFKGTIFCVSPRDCCLLAKDFPSKVATELWQFTTQHIQVSQNCLGISLVPQAVSTRQTDEMFLKIIEADDWGSGLLYLF